MGTEHLLLGLIHEGEGVAAVALDSLGVSAEAVRTKVAELVGPAGTGSIGSPPFTPRAKKVLELSLREAQQMGHSYIGTEHLLLGLLREGQGVAPQVLVALGVDLGLVRQRVFDVMSGRTFDKTARTVRPSYFSELNKRSPRCPQCHADLVEVARFRRIEVTSADDGEQPISIETVYCERCGVALEMFKSEPRTTGSA